MIGLALLFLCTGWSAGVESQVQVEISQGFPWQGLSIFTTVMALLYAGHLAQDRTSLGWRLLLFVLGFPLTFVATFLVIPGSQRVLGVDLPRHDLQAASGQDAEPDCSEEDPERRERRAAWESTIALVIGVSIVLVLAPSTEYRSEAIGEARYAVEKRTYWGWGDEPWLVVRRDGIRDASEENGWREAEWSSTEWQFEASLEAMLTLLVLLALGALCLGDELRRRRSEAGHTGPAG